MAFPAAMNDHGEDTYFDRGAVDLSGFQNHPCL